MVYPDTSVIVALLSREPSTEAVLTWFAASKQGPVSSDWMLTEFTSAISIKVRTGRLAKTDAKALRCTSPLLGKSAQKALPRWIR